MWRKLFTLITIILSGTAGTIASASGASAAQFSTYTIPDTGQMACYDDQTAVPCADEGVAFYGQDAQYVSAAMAYIDNGDGTVTDLVTGLMWQQTPGDKMTWEQAMAGAATFDLAGYTDWRLPTIKELYSLIDFRGITGMSVETSVPYINTDYFDFEYGNEAAGERMIDAQYWSSTEYTSMTMGNNPTVFGVNFADGRIKGYGKSSPRGEMTQFVRYVRGGPGYGDNSFVDNGDGTITDQASGLMWMQTDSGTGMTWGDALAYCANLDFAGYGDWRLPDAKELQGLVDYSRSLDATNSAAIDPIFNSTAIIDELSQTDYAFYWTSTTHLDGRRPGDRAVYIAFGEALGYMNNQFVDVHGAGAQRSDLKAGDPSSLPLGMGPQGDVQRIYNYARCVRGGDVTFVAREFNPDDVIAAQSPPAGRQGAGDVGPGAGGPSNRPANGGQRPGGGPPPNGLN